MTSDSHGRRQISYGAVLPVKPDGAFRFVSEPSDWPTVLRECPIRGRTGCPPTSMDREHGEAYVQPVLNSAVREEALARVGRALSDDTRRRLLLALGSGPAYPGELADRFGLTRSNVSNHLACLRGCGLVVATLEGRRTRYELADPRLARALDDLMGLVLAVDVDCRDDLAAVAP